MGCNQSALNVHNSSSVACINLNSLASLAPQIEIGTGSVGLFLNNVIAKAFLAEVAKDQNPTIQKEIEEIIVGLRETTGLKVFINDTKSRRFFGSTRFENETRVIDTLKDIYKSNFETYTTYKKVNDAYFYSNEISPTIIQNIPKFGNVTLSKINIIFQESCQSSASFDNNLNITQFFDLVTQAGTSSPNSTLFTKADINNIIYLYNALILLQNKGYIHRDIKPGNIVKCGAFMKLIDYEMMSTKMTIPNIRGTTLYTSPQVYKAVANPSIRKRMQDSQSVNQNPQTWSALEKAKQQEDNIINTLANAMDAHPLKALHHPLNYILFHISKTQEFDSDETKFKYNDQYALALSILEIKLRAMGIQCAYSRKYFNETVLKEFWIRYSKSESESESDDDGKTATEILSEIQNENMIKINDLEEQQMLKEQILPMYVTTIKAIIALLYYIKNKNPQNPTTNEDKVYKWLNDKIYVRFFTIDLINSDSNIITLLDELDILSSDYINYVVLNLTIKHDIKITDDINQSTSYEQAIVHLYILIYYYKTLLNPPQVIQSRPQPNASRVIQSTPQPRRGPQPRRAPQEIQPLSQRTKLAPLSQNKVPMADPFSVNPPLPPLPSQVPPQVPPLASQVPPRRLPPIITQPQGQNENARGGSAAQKEKTYIKFKSGGKKTYLVRFDASKRKYILKNKIRMYLKDLRGKYVYVSSSGRGA